MTSVHHAHHRTSPPNVKKTAVRAQRPTPLTRSASSRSVAKGGKAKKQADVIVDDEVQDDGMATSFLQFCAMCEKQIIVPNNSILYCSESCRRKDCNPTPTYNPYTTITSPFPYPHPNLSPSLHDPLGPHPKPLIPRLQPTVLPPTTTTTSRIPSPGPHFTPDLDPTEWKPKPASSASTYLALFHSPSTTPRSRTAASTTTTPSLSHTPSSDSSRDPSPVGTPADFVATPLPPPPTPLPNPPVLPPLPCPACGLPTLSGREHASQASGRCGYEKRGACENGVGTARAPGGLKTLLAAAVKGSGTG